MKRVVVTFTVRLQRFRTDFLESNMHYLKANAGTDFYRVSAYLVSRAKLRHREKSSSKVHSWLMLRSKTLWSWSQVVNNEWRYSFVLKAVKLQQKLSLLLHRASCRFTKYHTTNKCTNCMSFILNHFLKHFHCSYMFR